MSSRRDYHIRFSKQIEQQVATRLRANGYNVRRQPNNSRYDLLLDGRIRIEIKAARCYENNGRHRYQALFHNLSDVTILCCVTNGKVHHFVIPSHKMTGNINLSIWSENPAEYQGRWAPFYERWDIVNDLIYDTPVRYKQLEMGI